MTDHNFEGLNQWADQNPQVFRFRLSTYRTINSQALGPDDYFQVEVCSCSENKPAGHLYLIRILESGMSLDHLTHLTWDEVLVLQFGLCSVWAAAPQFQRVAVLPHESHTAPVISPDARVQIEDDVSGPIQVPPTTPELPAYPEVLAGVRENYYRKILPGLREAARSLGWSLAVHGSCRRDLDLVAVPWTEEAGSVDALLGALARVVPLIPIHSPEPCPRPKPHGRRAWVFCIPGAVNGTSLDMMLDLSVMDPRGT